MLLHLLAVGALAIAPARAHAHGGRIPAPARTVDSTFDGAAATARDLATAMSTGDSAARAAAVARRLTPAALAARGADVERLLGRVYEQGGGVDLVKVEPVGRSTFVTVRARRVPRLALLALNWDRADSARLRSVELLKAWHPAADSLHWPDARPAGDRALAALLDRNARRLAELGAFSGTVLVADGDRVVLERGYGWANRDDRVPNGPRTRFTTASMGKMFTAVAVAQLVEAGRLRLDDTLTRVLPDYPNVERARRVTVRQLLGHTAGLGDLWSHPKYDRTRAYASNRELAWAVADAPLRFAPGAGWWYSNEGYVVLGAVVERLGGAPYAEYLRRRVWGPAGMTETGYEGADAVVPHRAVGYRPADDDVLRVGAPRPNWAFLGPTHQASGAGGAYATARDFFRFGRALARGALVTPALRDTLVAGRVPLPWDAAQRYGYGFIRSAFAAGRPAGETVGHGGGGTGSGIDNVLHLSADGRYTVVVLGNGEPPAAEAFGRAIASLLARGGGPATR